jgi:drug/metabolite transporter (DMT)-like permease
MKTLFLLMLVALWYAAHITCHVVAKNVFHSSVLSPVLMTQLQLSTTLVISLFAFLVRVFLGLPVRWRVDQGSFVSAVFCAVGVWATNESTMKNSLLFTHLVKATEPLLSAVLLWVWQGQVMSIYQVLAIFVAVVGCILVAIAEKGESTTIKTILPIAFACVSSCAMSCRNVLLKLEKNDQSSFFADLIVIYGLASCAMLAITMVDVVYGDVGTVFDMRVAISCAAFGAYNTLSLAVMSNVGVVFHSLLNMSKRVFILIAGVLTTLQVSALLFGGLVLTTTGTVLFSRVKTPKSENKQESNITSSAIVAFILVTTIIISKVSVQ